MHIVQSALYRGDTFAGWGNSGLGGASGDAFSKLFGSTLDGLLRTSGVQETLGRLRERFPNLEVTEGETASGVEEAKAAANEEKTDQDQATISSSVLAGMPGSADLAKMVEDALAGFLDRPSASNLMNFEGAFVQRSLSISFTQIRYTEFHRGGATGELLGAADLKTGFHEQLNDLVRKFFGLPGGASDAATKTDDGKTGASDGSASVAMWSLEIYYSAASIASATDKPTNDDAVQNGQDAWRQSSFSASLRGSLAGVIPSALQATGGSLAMGGTDMWKSLENTLTAYGLAIGGLRSVNDGYSMRLREGRNLLAELMELYGGKMGNPAVEAPEEEAVGEVVSESAPQEEEAVAAI